MKLKALQEKRNEIVNSMKVMTETAETLKLKILMLRNLN